MCERETQRERETERDRDRETDRERQRQRQRHWTGQTVAVNLGIWADMNMPYLTKKKMKACS